MEDVVKHDIQMAISDVPQKGLDLDVYAEPRTYPQVVKYMGSKAAILDFLGAGLAHVGIQNRPIVDLFAGACSFAGGFGHLTKIISNDIQRYSAVIASSYLKPAKKIGNFDLVSMAGEIATPKINNLPSELIYPKTALLDDFNEIERKNRDLIYQDFDSTHHLFTRVYAGTWWSVEQCIWIDAFREVLDKLQNAGEIEEADHCLGLTCLMTAMAYTSQGTGHYAQYRDAKDASSMKDINRYRRASVAAYFQRKFDALLFWNRKNAIELGHELLSMDYVDCLASIPKSVVYSDPPYAFVHYSRFYHAMETIVRYDYPVIQTSGDKLLKGRYRIDRHQSPFCIKTQVADAFSKMFEGVKGSESDLLLSYSNTGMIGIDELFELANTTFGNKYEISNSIIDHDHKTMGRKADGSRKVEESLIIARRR